MPAGLGFLKGLSTALDTYQNQIDRQKQMKLAQIELAQKQVELQAMQQQAQIAGYQGKLDIAGALAELQGDQPKAPPVQPYSINQPAPQAGGPAAMPGGLPGARPMPGGGMQPQPQPQGGAQSGGGGGPMPPMGPMGPAPGAMMQGGMGPQGAGMAPRGMQPQGMQPQGIDSLPPPPSVQSIAQAFARKAQQQNMQIPPGAIMQLAQKAYPQARQEWDARREQLQYQQSERDRMRMHEDTEQDRRLSRAETAQAHADAMAMRQATLDLARSGLADRGWTVVTAKNGDIYRINAGTGETVKWDGAPAGMQKFGQSGGPKTGVGMLMQKWKEEHPGYTEEDMQDFLVNNARLMKSAQLLATKSVPLDQLANETRAIIPVVNDLSNKVNRTQYPSINRLIEAGEKGTGDTNVIRLGIAVGSVRDIFARVLNGGGAATDSSRSQANNFLNEAWSKGQINAATDQIMQELERAKGATLQTGRDIMSRPGDSNVPKITSDADYAKLPSGAEFIAPDGSHRRKP